jgi:hypothetical protein
MCTRRPFQLLCLSLCLVFLSACIFESSDKSLESQSLKFHALGPIYLKIGDNYNNQATSESAGVVHYQSSNETTAIVDSDGKVTVLASGDTVITASKVADNHYAAVSAQYSINVMFTVTAWIGEQDTQLSFADAATGMELYRSSDIACDFSNYNTCTDAQLNLIDGTVINDTSNTLSQSAIYKFSESEKFHKVSVPFSKPSDRFRHRAITFKGQLWVIGGEGHDDVKSDVWSSQDGLNWILKNPAAPFGARTSFSLVVFQDKLWLLGGYKPESGTSMSDVWSTVDGVIWVQEALDTIIEGGTAHLTAVFNNKIWLLQGFGNNTGAWTSSDGINWVKETGFNLNIDQFNGHELQVFDNKLWFIHVLGGLDGTWSSGDGLDWRYHPLEQELDSGLSFTAVFKGKLWFLDSDHSWSSSDGIHWELERDDFGCTLDLYSKITVFDDRIWIIGDHDFLYDNELQLCATHDAINWSSVQKPIQANARSGYDVINFKNKLWLIGDTSFNNDDFKNDVLTSIDGLNWQVMTKNAAFSARWSPKVFEFNNNLWLIGGYDGDAYKSDIWSSDDGINWVEEVSSAPFGIRTSYSITEFKNKLWLIGGDDEAGTKLNDIWSSTDGINWQKEAISSNFPAMALHHTVVFKDKMWSFGGEKVSDIWSTSDGVIWNLNENEAPFTTSVFGYVTYLNVFKNKLWMHFSSDKTYAWSSEDGINWIEETVSENVDMSTHAGHAMTLDEQLIFLGGRKEISGSGGQSFISNFVWASNDGINWRKGMKTDLSLYSPRE